jgi:hypothetical protein
MLANMAWKNRTLADTTYHTACSAAINRRWPVFSLSHVSSSKLQIEAAVEGMTSKLVWNYGVVVSRTQAVRKP